MARSNNVINQQAINNFIDTYDGPKQELARRSGLGRTTLYMVRHGQRQPGMKFIRGMLAAGMAPEKLFKV